MQPCAMPIILHIACLLCGLTTSLCQALDAHTRLLNTGPSKNLDIVRLATMPTSEAQRNAMLVQVNAFNAAHSDVQIQLKTYPHDDYKQQFSAWLEQDNPPADVLMWFAGERLRHQARNGKLAPIDPLLPKASWQAFPAGLLNEAQWQNTTYMLPLTLYPWGLYYNKDLFKQLQLDPPKTFEQLIGLCGVLSSARIEPILMSAGSQWPLLAWFDYLSLRLKGATFHKQVLSGHIAFRDPQLDVVFEQLSRIKTAGCFSQEIAKLSWEDAIPYLLRDRAGMMLMGNFFMAKIPKAYQQKIGFVPFVTVPSAAANIASAEDMPLDGLVVTPQAAKLKGTQILLAWFARADVQAALAQDTNMLPAHAMANIQPHGVLLEGLALRNQTEVFTQYFDRDAPKPLADAALQDFSAWWAGELSTTDLRARLDQSKYPQKVRLGADNWCPHNCADSAKDQGYLIDIAHAVFEPEGIQVEYINLSWSRALDMARRGDLDGVVGAFKGDAPDFVFPDQPQGVGANSFFTAPGSQWQFKGIASLADQRLSVINGYAYSPELDDYIAAQRTNDSRLAILSGDEPLPRALALLKIGRIDLLVEDAAVLHYRLQQQPELGPVREAGQLTNEPLYIAFSPQTPDAARLARLLSDGMQRLAVSGALARIKARYGLVAP